MKYIKLTNLNSDNLTGGLGHFASGVEKKLVKTKISLAAKLFIGLAIFTAIILFFIFGGSDNFFFERGGFDRTQGRTNVLFLGVGGEGHAGSNLADTIIVASVDFNKKDAALISIPRDLWIPAFSAKINSVYVQGEEKKKGAGLDFAKNVVGDVIGVPIHYIVKIDFTGFVRAVDLVGGLEIDVPRGFDDYKYPVAGRENDTCGFTISEVEVDGVRKTQILTATGSAILPTEDPFSCRYQHVRFEAGLQTMDGETALKYVRSRMGTNGSGSDFDRSERQKLVIAAFARRVFDLKNLFSPKKLAELTATFDENVDTNFSQKEIAKVPTLISQIPEFNFRSLTLSSEGEASLLYNPPVSEYGGVWVLLPKNNDWETLRREVKDFIFAEFKTS